MGRTSDAKERIVASAMQLFHERSYSAVGVQEICESAGVKKGSFYHFFPSKQDLVVEALDARWQFVSQFLTQLDSSSILSPVEKLTAFLRMSIGAIIESTTENGVVCGCPFGNLAAEISTHDEQIRVKVEDIYIKITRFLAGLIQDAIEIGEISPVDPGRCAQAIWAYTEGATLISKLTQDFTQMEQLIGWAIDSFLRPSET